MSKWKIGWAILFILGISLLNVGVLIEASKPGNQPTVDSFDQRPVPVYRGTVLKKECNNGVCDIDNQNKDCKVVNGKC